MGDRVFAAKCDVCGAHVDQWPTASPALALLTVAGHDAIACDTGCQCDGAAQAMTFANVAVRHDYSAATADAALN